MKPDEKTINIDKIIKFIASNWYTYAISVVALIVCMYTIYNVQDYQMRINDAWMEKINQHCSCSSFYKPDVKFQLQTPKEMLQSKDREYNNSLCFIGGVARPKEDCVYGVDTDGIKDFNNYTEGLRFNYTEEN